MSERFKSDLFHRFKPDDLSFQQNSGESGNEIEEYLFAGQKSAEFDRYLSMELDKSKLSSNLLKLWKVNQEKFPRLSCLTRSIF